MINYKALLTTDWIKTIYFNLYYFGISGFRLPVLVNYNFQLKKMKGKVMLGKNREGRIFLGRNDCFHLQGRGVWANEGIVVFENKCFIGNGTKIVVEPNAKLTFGKEVYITGNATFLCECAITIGDFSIISWNVTFMDSDRHAILNRDHQVINHTKEIVIGFKNWIGMDSLILKGTNLPGETIVMAKGIISKKFTETNCMIGNVNQIIKKEVYWKP